MFVHYLLSYYFIVVLNLGIRGTGYAGFITNFTIYAISLIYTYWIKELEDAVFWPDRRTLFGLREYLEIALPTAGMYCTQMWSREVIILMCGYVSTGAQATEIIVFNLLYMF